MRLPWLARHKDDPLVLNLRKVSASLVCTVMPHHEKGMHMTEIRA